MIWWIIGGIAYFAVAVLFFAFLYRERKELAWHKHYRRHPELLDPTWVLFLVALFWPLQFVGLFLILIGVIKVR